MLISTDGRLSTHFGHPTFPIADVGDWLPLTRLPGARRFLRRVEFHLKVGMLPSTLVALSNDFMPMPCERTR
jgi:hypothetical protein